MNTITIHYGLATVFRKLSKNKGEAQSRTASKFELPHIRKILEEFEETGQLCGQKLRDAGIEFSH